MTASPIEHPPTERPARWARAKHFFGQAIPLIILAVLTALWILWAPASFTSKSDGHPSTSEKISPLTTSALEVVAATRCLRDLAILYKDPEEMQDDMQGPSTRVAPRTATTPTASGPPLLFSEQRRRYCTRLLGVANSPDAIGKLRIEVNEKRLRFRNVGNTIAIDLVLTVLLGVVLLIAVSVSLATFIIYLVGLIPIHNNSGLADLTLEHLQNELNAWRRELQAGRLLLGITANDTERTHDDAIMKELMHPVHPATRQNIRAMQLMALYETTMTGGLQEAEEPNWNLCSKILYRAYAIALARPTSIWISLKFRYNKLQFFIIKRTFAKLFPVVCRLLLSALFLRAFLFHLPWPSPYTTGALQEYLIYWYLPYLRLMQLMCLVLIFSHIIPFLLYRFTERTWDDLDDVVVGSLSTPIVAILASVGTWHTVQPYFQLRPGSSPTALLAPAFIIWLLEVLRQDRVLQILIIIAATWIIAVLVQRVAYYLLLQWAHRTHQKYDDMFARLIQIVGVFLVVAFGVGVALAVLSGPIADATGFDSILLPYTIMVSVFTAVLGYALRAGFENFFSGLVLQVDRPFAIGHVIRLPSGKVYDVREYGMRTIILYDREENIEVSVPNAELATMTIENISRPDLQLRLALYVSLRGKDYLSLIPGLILDASYRNFSLDWCRVNQNDILNHDTLQGRRSIEAVFDEIKLLLQTDQTIDDLHFRPGAGKSPQINIVGEIEKATEKVTRLRLLYHNYLGRKSFAWNAIEEELALHDIDVSELAEIADPKAQIVAIRGRICTTVAEHLSRIHICALDLAAQYPLHRSALNALFAEISKEPEVVAIHCESDVHTFQVNVYTHHLERRLESRQSLLTDILFSLHMFNFTEVLIDTISSTTLSSTTSERPTIPPKRFSKGAPDDDSS